MQDELNWLGVKGKQGKGKGKADRCKGTGKGRDFGKGGGGGQGYGKGSGGSTGCTWCGDENHWRADCGKLKKHKADMDADRKRKGLPAFVPKPRGVNLLEVEDRNRDRQAEDADDEDHGDYEVTGLMRDSGGECSMLEIELRENIF